MRHTAEFVVRDAATDDIETWIELSAGLFADDSGRRDAYANHSWPEVNGAESFRTGLADPRALIAFAEHDGVPVGVLSARFSDPSEFCTVATASLGTLFVLPEFRSRAGGALLVGRFKRWAAELGARRLRVTAYAANEGALRFYRRQGFHDFELTLAIDGVASEIR